MAMAYVGVVLLVTIRVLMKDGLVCVEALVEVTRGLGQQGLPRFTRSVTRTAMNAFCEQP